MTHAPNGSTTPAGWYPDPSFPQQMRWWDGVQWTAQLAPPPGQFQPQFQGKYVKPQRPPISPHSAIYNAFIWIIAALPFLQAVLILTWNPEFRYMTTRQGITTIDPFSLYTPGYFVMAGGAFLIYAGSVALAAVDCQRLSRSGVVRPFHWAWAFLGAVVYVVGRSVIVYKVAQPRGLWPIWLMAAGMVLYYGVSIAKSMAMMQSMFSSMGYSVAT